MIHIFIDSSIHGSGSGGQARCSGLHPRTGGVCLRDRGTGGGERRVYYSNRASPPSMPGFVCMWESFMRGGAGREGSERKEGNVSVGAGFPLPSCWRALPPSSPSPRTGGPREIEFKKPRERVRETLSTSANHSVPRQLSTLSCWSPLACLHVINIRVRATGSRTRWLTWEAWLGWMWFGCGVEVVNWSIHPFWG